MKLNKIYQKYLKNELTKPNYILSMHKKHQLLFDYFDYIKTTDIQSIVIENEQIYVTIKGSGLKLFLDRLDYRFIPFEILNFKSIDPAWKDIVHLLASKSKIIFDIGANIGWYSMIFSKLENVEKIFAFEPIPHTYNYLKKHIQTNKIKNIYPNNLALTDKNGESKFFWSLEESGRSSMMSAQATKHSNKITCRTMTLNKFVKDNNTKIDMIKIDVEGAELLVFKGGIEIIKRDKPFIFTEMLRKWSANYNYHPNDIIKLFLNINYHCFAFVEQKIKRIRKVTISTIPTNYVFLHIKKHKDIIDYLDV